VADPLDGPQWKRMYAFCGQCWERKRVWAKGNVGYCLDCRPDWQPTGRETGLIDGPIAGGSIDE